MGRSGQIAGGLVAFMNYKTEKACCEALLRFHCPIMNGKMEFRPSAVRTILPARGHADAKWGRLRADPEAIDSRRGGD
jgi:hypothetical protein